MSIRWDFNCPSGTVTMTDGQTFRWFTGNALMIVLNEWKENNEEYYSLNWFFADIDHAKNCLGISKGYENIFKSTGVGISEITISLEQCYEWKRFIPLLIKAFPDIVITLKK